MGRGVCNLSTRRRKRRNVRFRAYSSLRTARLKGLRWKSELRSEENGKDSERAEIPEMGKGPWVGAWSEGGDQEALSSSSTGVVCIPSTQPNDDG